MRRLGRALFVVGALLPGLAGSAEAQTLLASDDVYGIPFGQPLEVEAFGVLDNDLLDDESAGESGATAELVSDVGYGTLAFGADGAFTYTPGAGFSGSDVFTYRAVFGTVQSETATVTLRACTGGPQIFSCWEEAAYLAMAAELGYGVFREGFEDDAAWAYARSPDTAPSVASRGIMWETNHSATNEITTGSGPARTGQWGVYDPDHGVAMGTPAACDIDDPPVECLHHDGFTGTRVAGLSALHGVGGFITGFAGANLAVLLDGATQVGLGQLPDPGFQFFGVIDAGATGFTTFEFRELDGKVGQSLFVFGDDFSLVAPETIPGLSAGGWIGLGVLLPLAARWWGRLAAGRRLER
jgi:hypothetical protein